MKFLVIQTAFIGDVVLATPVVEKLRRFFPEARIDFFLRKGNEKLLVGHPHLQKVWIWDKKRGKYRGLWNLLRQVRQERYDWTINCQRFATSGLITVLSGAESTVGFQKNPFARMFTQRVPHVFGTPAYPVHEVERNLGLITHLTDDSFEMPRLRPSAADAGKALTLVPAGRRFVCIAPTSVWFTKQFPAHKWLELIRRIPYDYAVLLLGGPDDAEVCDGIIRETEHPDVRNLAGCLSFLESAALMRDATMNYVNDSAPMHIASAVDAPVTAVFCSTAPHFGFTPLSSNKFVVESGQTLTCRPCGLHGHHACPKGHFACAETIRAEQFSPLPE
ncbi:MAG: glycosyltransferase family 9 protein [Lewinellaceae bacterium]|nr:glycosyltransferase family 9 protein [Lewinellaceae bacterium]